MSSAASIADSGLSAKVAREYGCNQGKEARDRRVACQGEDDRGVPRLRLHRRVVDRPHPRPAPQRLRDPREGQGQGLGAPRRQRQRGLRAALRRRLAEEEGRRRSEGEAEERRRAPARDGRRPRRRSDRLAPRPGAEAEGAGAPHGLPRDHAARDRACADRDARHRHEPRRRAGGAAHPRPSLRLRGLAGALAEGDAGAVGRACAVGGNAARRRAGAGAHAVPRRPVLGHRRDTRPRHVHGPARRGRRQARRPGPGLRAGRHAAHEGRRAACGGRRTRSRLEARRRLVHRHVGRGEAVHAQAGRSVHDLDAAAGGEPQAAPLLAADDAHGPAPLRERLHHLHAHRLDDAVGVGAGRGTRPGARALRSRLGSGCAPPLRAQGEERAGGPRGDPPGGRQVPHARSGAPRAFERGVQPLRPDLEAHRRLADGGRARPDGLRAHRRRRLRRPRAPSSRRPAP